jgi:hypothetical protein
VLGWGIEEAVCQCVTHKCMPGEEGVSSSAGVEEVCEKTTENEETTVGPFEVQGWIHHFCGLGHVVLPHRVPPHATHGGDGSSHSPSFEGSCPAAHLGTRVRPLPQEWSRGWGRQGGDRGGAGAARARLKDED